MLEIMNIIATYGWKGIVITGILLLIYKLLDQSVGIFTDRVKRRLLMRRQERLSMHTFFNNVDYFLNVEVQALNAFPTKPVRQTVTRDLIFCSLSSMREVAEKITKYGDNNWTNAEWTFQIRNNLNEMNTLFLNKCHTKGIPEVVYMKYLDWHFARLNHMRSLVDQIASSEMLPTTESKTSILLMCFSLFITTMMGDCETAMGELNGDITGMAYRGGIIEPLSNSHA